MQAGRRDRLITIMYRVGIQDPIYGSYTYEWHELGQEWAQVQDYLPSRGEKIADGISIARRPARIRLPYRDDVDMTMRVTLEGRLLGIIAGPAEIGRRKQIEVIAEELSTQGQEP